VAHLRVPSVLAVLLGAILPTGVRAQSINGRIVTADSSRGVPGAIVVLTDSVRRESTRTLSRADGRFVLRIAAPGTYGVRVLRIGFRPDDFGPFVIGPSANVPVVLALTQRAVSLMAMNVSDRSECRALDDGGSAPLALWEEARKSLLATVLTRSTLAPILTMASFERVVDAKSQRQLALRVRRQTGASTRPYVSPLSPDEYAARGYVEADDGSVVFRAPDADVLLSESFLVSHCARIVASPRDTSIIGLGFRPTRTERGRVDVEAVLWLARSPVELRSIDVSYVGVSDAVREAGAGASLILNRIPDGGLIVSSWVIRAPRVITVKGFQASVRSLSGRAVSRDSIADVWNIGGAVMRARVGETEVWRGPAARLEGHVREDETGRPVAGVGLVLVGTNYAATADSTGAFSIADVLPGEYELVARSPQLEALGLDVPTAARLQLGDSTSTADIRMPAVRKALARVCAMSDTLGAVQGRVEDAEHRGVGDARVVARWLTTARVVTGVGVLGQGPTLSILTDADGRFRLCGLPRYHDVVLSAARENLVASPQTIRIEPGQDLAVVTLTTHRSMHLATADGLGAVDGVVRDESGTLMKDVDVDLVGVSAARTDSVGRFSFGSLDSGTFLLRTRRVGWSAPLTQVNVEFGLRTTRDVVMGHVQELSGITVSAPGSADLGGFARRRAAGHGSFITEEQIAARNARTTEQLLETLPGVAVFVGKFALGAFISVDRGAITLQGTPCKGVAVFVDGTEVPESFNVAQINPRDLRGVELYHGVGTTPPELRSTRTVCGTLAFWLK